MKIVAKEDLQKRRLMAGMSSKKMAESADMTYQGYWRMESGRGGISPERSRLIVDALGVEFEDVFEIIERN